MIRTVFFDLDGTLLDTVGDLTAAVNECMKKYGGPVYSERDIRNRVGHGIYVTMERSLPGGRANPRYNECMIHFAEYYRKHAADLTRPFPGITDMLLQLSSRNIRIGIVSNKFDAAVKDLSEHFFPGLISAAVGASPEINSKPAPDTLLKAMGELGSAPNECLYVGDSDVDIATARNAGVKCYTKSGH